MKTLRFLAMAMAAIWFVSFLGTLSSGAPPRGGPPKGNKPDVYSVLQVLQVGQDPSDASDIRVIRKSDVKIEEKRIKDEDAQYKKDYDEAKKNANKTKSTAKSASADPDQPPPNVGKRTVDLSQPPIKRKVKVLVDSCKSIQDAQELADKYRREGVPDPKSTKKPAAS